MLSQSCARMLSTASTNMCPGKAQIFSKVTSFRKIHWVCLSWKLWFLWLNLNNDYVRLSQSFLKKPRLLGKSFLYLCLLQVPLKACEEVPVEKCQPITRQVCENDVGSSFSSISNSEATSNNTEKNCRKVARPMCRLETRKECTCDKIARTQCKTHGGETCSNCKFDCSSCFSDPFSQLDLRQFGKKV